MDVPLEFLRGVYEADYDLAMMDDAVEMAALHSPAWYFAEFHRAAAEATLEWATWAGPACQPGVGDVQVFCPEVSRVDAATIEVCAYDWGMLGWGRCGEYTDFEFIDGRLATFRVRGLEIEPRLGVMSSPVTVGPVTVQVASSYLSSPENWFKVAFVIGKADGPTSQTLVFGVEYVDPDGRRPAPISIRLVNPMPPQTQSMVGIGVFERADPGGTLLVSVDAIEHNEDCSGDGSCEIGVHVADLELDVPAL